ncbi:Flagella accessory C family protein [Natrialba chahannaoensis JCM 10990]|uniref:Flagella accessory C family protein n=1 Tax=Natrialba chahannaoensis JCM 10990 TaxID=1227492 RepID=M0A2U2_9EURY|nr:FlaD/FlaE family flagellar protein [Natrialba chahannaoensis]ELY93075.1 Flagella accessory C family protein [Natrialba chahannaoensis JCM 10990]
MVLSIIGNILGDGDGDGGSGRSSSENDSDDIIGGDLTGSMSDDELLPGARSESAGGSNGGTGGDGTGDDDLFDDGDLGGDLDGDLDGGGDDFLDDDSMSMDDMGEISEMGDMDDMGSMDGMDDGTTVSSEIEARVEEMENSVGSLSSTVNTVQSENEKIGESLDDIEENIRKLLEVYEMVTQGVNPFVEGDTLADSMTAGGAAGSGNFGGQSLFDSNDDGEEDEAIDEDIANAEADDFLDESIIDEDDGFDDGDDDLDDLEDDMSMDADADSDLDADADSGGDDDLSFDELKSEYDSGDADWDANKAANDNLDDGGSQDAEDVAGPLDDDLEDDSFGDDLEDDSFDDDLTVEDEPVDETASLIDDADANAAANDATEQADASLEHPTWDDGGRPYLETIPSEYDTEFVVMDWLEYLVSELGLNGAARTLRFYESIHWVSTSVESHLQTVLNGFGGGPDIGDPEPHSSLGVEHKRSLWWISQIATPEKKRRPFDVWVADEGIMIEQAMAAAEQHQPEAATADDATPTTGDVGETDAAATIDDERPATTAGEEPAVGAPSEELTFDESAATTRQHESSPEPEPEPDPESEPVAVADTDEHAAGSLDTHDSPDGALEEDANDHVNDNDDDDIELEFTTDESLDPFAVEGDEHGSTEHSEDDCSELGVGDEETAAATATADELESSGAQKIFIEEAEEEADTPSPDHRNDPAADRVEPEAEVTDGGQMIWVDSDVVLSESGARLCNTRTTAGGVDRGARAEIAKPLVVSDEPADLEGWQVERIKLLLAPEEFDIDREHGTDHEEAADEHEQAREREQ